MHQWIGEMFYRGIDPSRKAYTELRYYHDWHAAIEKTKADSTRP